MLPGRVQQIRPAKLQFSTCNRQCVETVQEEPKLKFIRVAGEMGLHKKRIESIILRDFNMV